MAPGWEDCMGFKDQIKRDALNVFLNPQEFAETITYTKDGQSGKSIQAVVVRKPQQPATEDNARIGINDFEIFISADPVSGIDAIRRGKDKVTVGIYQDSTQTCECLVVEVLESDPGMWHLVIRK